MAEPAPPTRKGRLVLVGFGIAILMVIVWLVLRAPLGPSKAGKVEQAGVGEAPEQPIAYYLARGDAARGQSIFQRCASCHTIGEGASPGVGPNLRGVLGGPVGARPGFSYSAALRELGGRWDWESASRFLRAPREVAPGTRMAFSGLTNPQDRADLLLYLNQQGGSLAAPAR